MRGHTCLQDRIAWGEESGWSCKTAEWVPLARGPSELLVVWNERSEGVKLYTTSYYQSILANTIAPVMKLMKTLNSKYLCDILTRCFSHPQGKSLEHLVKTSAKIFQAGLFFSFLQVSTEKHSSNMVYLFSVWAIPARNPFTAPILLDPNVPVTASSPSPFPRPLVGSRKCNNCALKG